MYTKTKDPILSSQTGRNQTCPCGSGKKYKNCCQKRRFLQNKKQQNKVIFGVLGIVAVIAAAVVFSKNNSATSIQQQPLAPSSRQSAGTLPGSNSTPKTGYTPQPPGPAPAGKVWSPEHGHWHDIPGTTPTSTPLTTTSNVAPSVQSKQLTPQPPGPVPEGKVWSPEHGHWHDAPGVTSTATAKSSSQVFDITPDQLEQTGQASGQKQLTPQPPGPVPEGKVWSPEHDHWHDVPTNTRVLEIKTDENKESKQQSDPK